MQKKLAFTFIGFALVPLIVVSQLLLVYIYKNQASNLAEDAVRVIKTQLTYQITEKTRDLSAFTASAHLWERSPEAMVAFCNTMVAAHPDYKLIMMVNAEGVVEGVNSKDAQGEPLDTAELTGKSFERSSWFQRAQTSEDVVLETPKDLDFIKGLYKVDHLRVFPVAKAIHNQAGQLTGVWVVFFNADFLGHSLEDVAKDLNMPGQFSIYDFSGVVLAKKDTLVGQELGDHQAGSEILKLHGQEWSIKAYVKEQDLLLYLREYMWPFLVFIGFIVMYAFVAARRLTLPLLRLCEATEQVCQGKGKVEMPYTDRRDDLGQLARLISALQPAPKGESIGPAVAEDKVQLTSKKIEDTVQLINGLSAQANMLALNASMEAVNAHHLEEVAEKANELAQQTSYNSQELLKKLSDIKVVCDEIQSQKTSSN